MRNAIWTGACTAIVGLTTAAMFAQAPQTPQTPPAPAAPQASAASAEGKITVTGCLKPDPASQAATAANPTGTSSTSPTAPPPAGTAGSTNTDAKFLLTDASSAPAAANPNDVAAPPPAAATPGTATYRLIANPSALTPHLGKKLALTGTLEKQNATPAASQPAAGSESSMLALRVESGKIIAETCTGGQ